MSIDPNATGPLATTASTATFTAASTTRRPSQLLLGLLLVAIALSGCSVQKFVAKQAGNALSNEGTVFSADDDPELVGDALPFALKTMEGVLAKTPDHRKLLLATCRTFTSYSAGYVQAEAEELAYSDYERSAELEGRAVKLFLRAKGYCLRALDLAYPKASPALSQQLLVKPEEALAIAREPEDAELLYWTGASWGAAISQGLDRPELVIDLPAARALITRALELDPSFGNGAIHEAMVSIEALPATMGGSIDRAREHFDRAIELSGGHRAGTYVTWANAVSVPQQDRAEFEAMLEKALAVDPDKVPADRLANLIAQRRARLLLERVDDLFLGGDEELSD